MDWDELGAVGRIRFVMNDALFCVTFRIRPGALHLDSAFLPTRSNTKPIVHDVYRYSCSRSIDVADAPSAAYDYVPAFISTEIYTRKPLDVLSPVKFVISCF